MFITNETIETGKSGWERAEEERRTGSRTTYT
jgi:hypothetical protein